MGAAGLVPFATTRAAAAPSGGDDATWTTGKKYGVGTVADHRTDDASRVWFTLTEGALTEVRFPRIDLLNVRTLDFVVADPDAGYAKRTFDENRTDEGTVERSVELVDDRALLFEQTVTETASGRGWTLTAEYVAAPGGDALLADVTFEATDGGSYDVYAVLDASVAQSGMADTAAVRGTEGDRVLTATDTEANDGDAVIVDEAGNAYNPALAMASASGFEFASADVAGGDGLSGLLSNGSLGDPHGESEGNVALVGRLGSGVSSASETLSLGFATGRDVDAAVGVARDALSTGYAAARSGYRESWHAYLDELDAPSSVSGDLRTQYDVSAMALRAADSKNYPGAGIASPSVPWGDATEANNPSDYGYNFVWSRDLYQAYTAMLAMGDVEGARDATEYIYDYQQRENGFVPQNTFVDGRTRWGGEQMDNVSWPQVMAYQLWEREDVGFDDADYDYENVRLSATYVATNGPHTDQERWEEESGYSPSTTAAEIAGLACAAALADAAGERTDALLFLGVADRWQSTTEEWMATTQPPELEEPDDIGDDYDVDYTTATTPYYFRVNDDTDPNDGAPLDINNGGPSLDERSVIDAGFLELVRLGVKPWDDPVVENSLDLVDRTIQVDTPNGPAWYRYTEDGYGEQGRDDADDLPAGAPWGANGDNAGRGRLWPIFSGERGEYELLSDADEYDPAELLESMHRFGNSGYMIPEQVWDRTEPTAYGWEFGEGTGSATPLSWSMAQFVRLAWGIDAGEPVETPAFVADRYVESAVPEGPDLSVEFPSETVRSDTVTVSGTTDGATVVVATTEETVAVEPSGGSFETEVTVADGTSDLTVVAATDAADLSGVGTTARTGEVRSVSLGDRVALFDDETGDDHGPGSYTYPTADAFVDGAFDVDSVGIYETDERYQFLYTLAGPLTNPFGGAAGFSLQALQVYVRDPSADGGATAAREGVNAEFAAPYQRRVVADGFTGEFAPRVEDAAGGVVTEDVSLTAYPEASAVKVGVPKSSLGGDVRTLQFAPLLMGQDGFSPGRIRPVNAANGGYVFGGGRDDDRNPNVIDLVVPDGTTQADTLSYDDDPRGTVPYLSVGTRYQVDFAAGEPIEELGDDGLYADQDRLMRFAFGSVEEGITEKDTAWPSAEIRDCLDYGHIVEHDDGTASVTFTVADDCDETTLSLAVYSMPGDEFTADTADEQVLLDSTTGTFGPGDHTITVDLPGGGADDGNG
ncbi:glucoamylase / glycosyl hydrolase [Candidatus Halobonum tyrrellensis G22]|uniref:Glucoamylase / glycosyl hydrolase n=1 Tax=Candidatus Halobonum tyrrellensis G22 TaxID=1324957 RepID=V4H8P9_9EURY|nr:glucoamylase / glycosyl hydrolase [Candidatus Halobonum tyrrellensis G22]